MVSWQRSDGLDLPLELFIFAAAKVIARLGRVARVLSIVIVLSVGTSRAPAQDLPTPTMLVKAAADFEITGDGQAAAWKTTEWTELNKRGKGAHDYAVRVKLLYSPTGLYVFMESTDSMLTASLPNDFDDLWNEDVFEVFLWTDERYPVYFEYEISPLNKELPIIIPNFEGKFFGWRPWHYEGERKTKKAVKILGGTQASGAKIQGWRAEVFFPYDLLKPLENVPPKSGMRWRTNFYRVDYDDGKSTAWDWARVGPSFHEYKKFGTLVFE